MMRSDTDDWFVTQVLPLEESLWRFLRRNCHNGDEEVSDLMQEVYVRLYESARTRKPEQVKPFMFSIARNLLIDRARRSQVVSIEAYADLDALDMTVDTLSPERHLIGMEELRLLQNALDDLPVRCREVVQLRKIDGLSQRDVAAHMGITEDTVEKQMSKGIRALAENLLRRGVAVTLARKVGAYRKRIGVE
ncbi:RNA polymerase sigma factor [Herbaspirillum chlorophenolicum]|uniref:RNA polymerase sigma factor n=1 Tax=Herbaspirillum chlorophenolicum TaxID=211589 RepID=A0ABW8ETB1_9BURK|nr:RNA polymerase sigma factor [Herbaspirillum chlorophenolicum]